MHITERQQVVLKGLTIPLAQIWVSLAKAIKPETVLTGYVIPATD